MSSKFYGAFLALSMLVFGTANTVFSKYQNLRSFECVNGTYECEVCPTDEGEEPVCINFEQPVYQTFTMFLGEFLCFFVYYISLFLQKRKAKQTGELVHESKLTGWRKLIFVVPTLCDMTATTLMNLGLIYTYASVYQMLRGAVVVFTGIMSVLFLKRKQYPFHWFGMLLVVAGVTVVGSSSILFAGDSAAASDPVLGAILIVSAQVFTAFQFVYEEKYLSKYEVPALQAVGFEGLYGVAFLSILMPIFQAAIGNKQEIGNLFDVRFAFEAFLNFPSITVSSLGSIMSIAFFNFFGLTITKVLSSTARSTIDACRTLSVWGFGLIVGWELWDMKYSWIQVAGFLVLLAGTFSYNQIIKYPCFNYIIAAPSEESRPLNAPTDDSEDERNGKNYSSTQ